LRGGKASREKVGRGVGGSKLESIVISEELKVAVTWRWCGSTSGGVSLERGGGKWGGYLGA